jgi:glutathione-specific gamma-glutamylcyclotransferase
MPQPGRHFLMHDTPSPTKPPYADLVPAAGDLWVFGYGSLMWDPGFDHVAAERAWLHGYHRAFCMYSHRHRGTAARPGLVLALDRGGSCQGIAYRVRRNRADAVLAYLWEREMPRYAYLPRTLKASIRGGAIDCVTFIVDRTQPNYAGRLHAAEAAAVIADAVGERGRNRDYLASTVRHLDELGIADGVIHEILRIVEGG